MRPHAPQIEIAGNATAVAERAAARVVARLRDRHAVTLGFATGATMRPVYARLVAATRGGDVSFRAVSSFNLDEYVGVAPQSPGSFHAYMQEHLFGHVDMETGRARIPDGMAGDIAASTYHQIFLDQDLGPSVGRVVNDISVAVAAGEMSPEDAAAAIQQAWDEQ